MKTIWTLLLATTMLSAPALAKDDPAEKPAAEAADKPSAENIDRALRLPQMADRLRKKGVEDAEVGKALGAAKDKGMTAHEAEEALEEADAAVEEHGPVDNFGAFVQSKLDEGLRGKDLAAAIRAEHEAHGKGKGHGKGGEHGKPDDKGKDADHGKGEHSRPDGKGKSDEHGKPDGKGKPEQPGKPADKGEVDASPKGGPGAGPKGAGSGKMSRPGGGK